MRKTIIVLAISALSVSGFSQMKPVLLTKISTPNALCEECKTKIETYLKRIDGVTYVNVNYRKGETTVKYVTDRVNIEEIRTAIANAGFDADSVSANTEFYKLLPKCCKKPEDGGLPQKKPTTLAPQ